MSICPSSLGPSNIKMYKIHDTKVIKNKTIKSRQCHQEKSIYNMHICRLCTSNDDNINTKFNNIVVEQYMLHNPIHVSANYFLLKFFEYTIV